MSGRYIRPIVIGLCFVVMVLPAMGYYRTPPEWTVMGVLRTTFPAWLVLFGMLCVEQGRDQERERRERADQEKQSPPR